MNISATINNSQDRNEVVVSTNGQEKEIVIPVKAQGKGLAINGGELLFLSIATCFCNDIYREAVKRKMDIRSIKVEVAGKFGAEGEPGSNIQYQVTIDSDCTDREILEMVEYVDKIAEIHNTIRKGTNITLIRSSNTGM